MAKKRPVDWAEIRARYELGEQARTIVRDYEDLTAAQVHSKASKQRWGEALRKRSDALVTAAHDAQIEAVQDICTRVHQIHQDFLSYITTPDSEGIIPLHLARVPFIPTGFQANPIFKQLLDGAIKIAGGSIKGLDEVSASMDGKKLIVSIKRPGDRDGREA